jgi:hypothetical protein
MFNAKCSMSNEQGMNFESSNLRIIELFEFVTMTRRVFGFFAGRFGGNVLVMVAAGEKSGSKHKQARKNIKANDFHVHKVLAATTIFFAHGSLMMLDFMRRFFAHAGSR